MRPSQGFNKNSELEDIIYTQRTQQGKEEKKNINKIKIETKGNKIKFKKGKSHGMAF